MATISDQQSSRSEDISQALIEIGSLLDQEAEEATALQNDERTCCENLCDAITSRIGGKGFVPVVEMKPSMRRAQREGKKELKELIFPLFSDTDRELVTYGNAVLAFASGISVINMIISAVNGDTIAVHQYVHLAIWLFSLLLFQMDLFVSVFFIHKCKLIRNAYIRCNYWCTNTKESPKFEQLSKNNSPYTRFCSLCKFCCNNCYVDLVRLLLMGVCIYPLTISSLFEVMLSIQSLSQNDTTSAFNLQNHTLYIDRPTVLNIASLVFTAVWYLFLYVLCLAAIIRTIRAINKYRKDGPAAKSGRVIHYWFIAHVIGQIMAQTLMIVWIGGKMYYENREYSAVGISPYLWYMIAGGCIIPFAGVFTFAIFNYYHIQEYPIGLFIDMLHNEVINTDDTEVSPEALGNNAKTIKERLLKDFNNVSQVNKYINVLGSPLLVSLTIVYGLFLPAFIICCMLDRDPVSGVTAFIVFNGSKTALVFFAMGVLVYFFNFFMPLVVACVVYCKCSGKNHSLTTELS